MHASSTWWHAPQHYRGQALMHMLGATKAQLLLLRQEKPEIFTFCFVYKEEILPLSCIQHTGQVLFC